MAPEDGSSMMFLSLAEGANLDEACANTIQSYDLAVLEQRETTYNGLTVKTLIATQNLAQGEEPAADPVKIKISLIQYSGLIYTLGGASNSGVFSESLSIFNEVMRSFRPLNDSNMLNKQPERIRIKTVNQSANFSQVMTGFGTPESRLEELAILNGMNLTDQVEKGMLIKTVE